MDLSAVQLHRFEIWRTGGDDGGQSLLQPPRDTTSSIIFAKFYSQRSCLYISPIPVAGALQMPLKCWWCEYHVSYFPVCSTAPHLTVSSRHTRHLCLPEQALLSCSPPPLGICICCSLCLECSALSNTFSPWFLLQRSGPYPRSEQDPSSIFPESPPALPLSLPPLGLPPLQGLEMQQWGPQSWLNSAKWIWFFQIT